MVGVQDLAWSADGNTLYFSAMRVKPDYSDYRPDKWAVYAYRIAGGTVRRLVGSAFSVAAAPSGDRIVVGKLVDGNRDLFILDAEGNEIARLTSDPADDFGAAWAPDGRRIAFTSKRTGHAAVFVADADGSNPRRLVDAGADRTFNPTWSPDGQWIAFYREKGDGADQIHVARPDGTGDRNVTNDGFNNVFPGWTPDGRIVYGQGQKGQPTNAFTVGVDGSGKRPLLGIKSFFARYAPDGGRLAYLEEHPEADGVRVIIASRQGQVLAMVPLVSVGSSP
jgi:Tol biopolymer transport system component